jgi:integrase
MIDLKNKPSPRSTLSQFFAWAEPELLEISAANTVKDYRAFVAAWIRITGDPPLEAISRDDLYHFRETLLAGQPGHPPAAPSTVGKYCGHFRKFMAVAVDLQLVDAVPQIYVFRKGALPPGQSRSRKKPVRELLNADDMTRLFVGAARGNYPSRVFGHRMAEPDRVFVWRASFYFAWLYGLRVSDLRRMAWTWGHWSTAEHSPHGLLRFDTLKTSRLQGLPFTPRAAGVFRQLRAIGRRLKRTEPDPLFVHLARQGSFIRPKNGRASYWTQGWHTTLQRDICAPGGIIPTSGTERDRRRVAERADRRPPITWHNFRQTAVAAYNDYRSDTGRRLGAWIAGHSARGVDQQHYDQPTAAVWAAIQDREAHQLPECFRHYFPEDPKP